MNNIPENYPTPEDDPLGLRVDIGAAEKQVQIKYSKPIISLHLWPHQARSMAIALLTHAEVALSMEQENEDQGGIESNPRLP